MQYGKKSRSQEQHSQVKAALIFYNLLHPLISNHTVCSGINAPNLTPAKHGN